MTTSIDYMNEIPPERDIHDTFRECLSQAEAAFGARCPGWQYAVRLRDSPSLPETVVTSIDMVTVWLTKERSRVGYLFEAGHEVVHCLNPGPPDSTYLEEAVATAFSRRLVFSRFGQPGLDRDYAHQGLQPCLRDGSHHRQGCGGARQTATRPRRVSEEGTA